MNLNLTEIVFLLDRSGSMGGLESDTIGGFNAFMDKQSQLAGDATVTAVLFDERYEILWDGIEIKNAKLSGKEYYVRGSTALLDAVGKTILDVGYRLANIPEDQKPGKVIFVITTDGMENASREFTYEKVRELIGHQQQKYNWDFIFLGANIDVATEAVNLGILAENAYAYQATEVGVEDMYNRVCEMVNEIRHDYIGGGK
jgi:hypothetical protein